MEPPKLFKGFRKYASSQAYDIPSGPMFTYPTVSRFFLSSLLKIGFGFTLKNGSVPLASL